MVLWREDLALIFAYARQVFIEIVFVQRKHAKLQY